MRTWKLAVLLAVVAMTMAVMAPASASGKTTAGAEARGWSCFDNSGDGGAGNHCSQIPIGDYIAGGSGGLFLMVFSPGEGDVFLGVENLRFTSTDMTQFSCDGEDNWVGIFPGLYACHRWA